MTADSSTRPEQQQGAVMGAAQEETMFAKSLKILLVVAAYWVVSISMVFLNKKLLSSEEFKLDAPLFITWYQCVVAVVCCFLFGTLADHVPALSMFPPFSVKFDICYRVLPLSLVFVGMISFNNLCLKLVGVSFYNVGRSLSTVFNVALTYLILGDRTSFPALACCSVIVFGFFLGVDQEGSSGDLSLLGVAYGVLASMCVALNSIYMKQVLPVVEFNTWRLTLYNNLNACLLFLPLILLWEWDAIVGFEQITSLKFWSMMTLAGFFGIAIGLVTMLQVKHTSPLTHNISGTAKACAQTVLSVFLNEEVKTLMWWGSNGLVLGGSMLYANVRHKEMAKAQAAKPLPR